MKTWKKRALLFAVLLIGLFAGTVTASADFRQIHRDDGTVKIGKRYFTTDDQRLYCSAAAKGAKTLLVAADDMRGILTNGNQIYYGVYRSGGLDLYRSKVSTPGAVQKVGRVKKASWLEGYYKGKLYVSKSDVNDLTDIHTYVYTIKTKSLKRVIKHNEVKAQSGRYLAMGPNSGAVIELPYRVYNCKTGKSSSVTKKGMGVGFSGKYLYYAEFRSYTKDYQSKVRIRRYNCSTKSRKTISSKTIALGYVLSIDGKSMTYYKGGKYYKYTYSTKKTRKIADPFA